MSFTQPRGRPRKGCYWNTTRGGWEPSDCHNAAVRIVKPPPSVDPALLAKRALETEERLKRQAEEEAQREEDERIVAEKRAERICVEEEARRVEDVQRRTERYPKCLKSYLPAPCHIYYMTPDNCVYGVDDPRRDHKQSARALAQ